MRTFFHLAVIVLVFGNAPAFAEDEAPQFFRPASQEELERLNEVFDSVNAELKGTSNACPEMDFHESIEILSLKERARLTPAQTATLDQAAKEWMGTIKEKVFTSCDMESSVKFVTEENAEGALQFSIQFYSKGKLQSETHAQFKPIEASPSRLVLELPPQDISVQDLSAGFPILRNLNNEELDPAQMRRFIVLEKLPNGSLRVTRTMANRARGRAFIEVTTEFQEVPFQACLVRVHEDSAAIIQRLNSLGPQSPEGGAAPLQFSNRLRSLSPWVATYESKPSEGIDADALDRSISEMEDDLLPPESVKSLDELASLINNPLFQIPKNLPAFGVSSDGKQVRGYRLSPEELNGLKSLGVLAVDDFAVRVEVRDPETLKTIRRGLVVYKKNPSSRSFKIYGVYSALVTPDDIRALPIQVQLVDKREDAAVPLAVESTDLDEYSTSARKSEEIARTLFPERFNVSELKDFEGFVRTLKREGLIAEDLSPDELKIIVAYTPLFDTPHSPGGEIMAAVSFDEETRTLPLMEALVSAASGRVNDLRLRSNVMSNLVGERPIMSRIPRAYADEFNSTFMHEMVHSLEFSGKIHDNFRPSNEELAAQRERELPEMLEQFRSSQTYRNLLAKHLKDPDLVERIEEARKMNAITAAHLSAEERERILRERVIRRFELMQFGPGLISLRAALIKSWNYYHDPAEALAFRIQISYLKTEKRMTFEQVRAEINNAETLPWLNKLLRDWYDQAK